MAAAAPAAHVDREVKELVGATARASLDDDGCRKCSRAFEEKEKLLSCVCRKVRYCNEACQKADWKNHRPSCPKFVVKESPGKGKGVFATRKLPFGTVILYEEPLMAVPYVVDRHRNIMQEFEKLSDEKQKKFLNLYHTGSEINSANTTKKVVSIFECNAFEHYYLCEQDRKRAVFETLSRINHSCAPNARRNYNEVRASREIGRGEEIFISYIGKSVSALRHERALELSKWKFECSCQVCSLEGDELTKNENLRKQIEDAYEEFQRKREQFKQGRIKLSQLLPLAKRKLNLLRQLKGEMIQCMDVLVLDCYEISVKTDPKNPENEEYRKEARYLSKLGRDVEENYKVLIKHLKDSGFPIPEID